MNTRRSTLIGSAIAFALFQQAAPSLAQTAASTSGEALEEVVVTGIRGSLQQSLEVKRDADSRMEVVTAEDVGKLPAHNVADALRGLPGVNISSSSADEGGFDEADRVSLRGTSPSLTQTLINGHTVASADWFVLSQGNNVGRSVSYSLLPSELVSSVQVSKSSQAKLQDGGTTGNVNIITRKPLQFSKALTFEASVGGVRSDQAESNDPQLSGLFNYKNEDGNFGVLLQVFKQKRELRREAQEVPGGFFQIAATDPAGISNPDLVGVYVPGLLGSTLFEQTRDRKGGLLDVQWKPTDDLTLGLSGFLSKMDADNYNRNFMMWGAGFGRSQAPQPGYTVENGVLTNATYAGVPGTNYVVYDMIARESEAKTHYVSFDVDWNINDTLSSKFQAGTTKGVGTTPRQFIAEVQLATGGGVSWAGHGIGSPLDWSAGGNLGPSAATGFGTWGNQLVRATDEEKWANIDFSLSTEAGALRSLDFGLRVADHDRKTQSPAGANPGAGIFPALQANGVTGSYPGGFASNIGGNFPRDIWYYTFDSLKEAVVGNSVWNPDPGASGRRNYGAEWSVAETNFSGYVQANFGGDSWSGNLGVRFVDVDQDISSYRTVEAGSAEPVDVTSLFAWPNKGWVQEDYNNRFGRLLPSANLKFDATDDLVLRLAASQTQTLPDYSAIGAASWGSDLTKTGGGGNPNLRPVVSNNMDASVEWYFMPRGLVSASLFSMQMKDYVAFGTEIRRLPSELTNQIEDFTVSVPTNVGASVAGVELNYEQPIGDSFGFNANYTYANGSVDHTWADGSNNMVGTSKNTYNVGAYFENDMFGARLSYTYRSAFLIGLSGANPYYQDDFGTVSLALSYKPTEWMSVSLDALNLNDPSLTYYQSSDIPSAFYSNGRQYYLNFRFKY